MNAFFRLQIAEGIFALDEERSTFNARFITRLFTQLKEEGVAPGQACALYDPADPERLLGGGFIRDTTPVV